jgi:helicase
MGIGYEEYLSQVKTACLLEDWIMERSEEFMEKKYNVGPGDIRNKVETGRWLLYSMSELSRIFNPDHQRALTRLMTRVMYGVSEELLNVVSLRGIGRVRARSLFKHGYINKAALRQVSESQLARIPSIGPILAKSIKEQIG